MIISREYQSLVLTVFIAAADMRYRRRFSFSSFHRWRSAGNIAFSDDTHLLSAIRLPLLEEMPLSYFHWWRIEVVRGGRYFRHSFLYDTFSRFFASIIFIFATPWIFSSPFAIFHVIYLSFLFSLYFLFHYRHHCQIEVLEISYCLLLIWHTWESFFFFDAFSFLLSFSRGRDEKYFSYFSLFCAMAWCLMVAYFFSAVKMAF